MAVAGKFNIQVGSLKQVQAPADRRAAVGLSSEEAAELEGLFARLRCTVAEQAPVQLRGDAIAQTEQLEQAVVRERPDLRAARGALRWFRMHTPQLVAAVTAVLVDPLVGKLVESAGTPVSDRFHALLESAS